MQFADRNSPHNDAGTPRRMSLSRGRVLEFRQKPLINDESPLIRMGKRFSLRSNRSMRYCRLNGSLHRRLIATGRLRTRGWAKWRAPNRGRLTLRPQSALVGLCADEPDRGKTLHRLRQSSIRRHETNR